MDKLIVGIVSFTDPRPTSLAREREEYIERNHLELKRHLEADGIEVLDPMAPRKEGWQDIYGVQTLEEVNHCVRELRNGGAQAVILGCWHWTEPGLTSPLVRDLNVPACLFIEKNSGWAASCCQASSGSSLWQEAIGSDVSLRHERIRGDYAECARWVRGAAAMQKLRSQTLMLWGSSHSLRMEHLRDDYSLLRSLFVKQILEEGQYYLIRGAERILDKEPQRVRRFVKWMERNGVQITYDRKMLTRKALANQIALYLAARDRLAEIEDDIAGVSVKCQHEISMEFGYTGCFLPAFLPFAEDSEGPQRIIPTTCEGDVKSLITCLLLMNFDAAIPPFFGDFKFAGDEYVLISNCGASSVYYAANSNDPSKSLKRVRVEGQCHCAGGGAVGWDGLPGPYTMARLVRVKDRYFMQLALCEAVKVTAQVKRNAIFGSMWPHHALKFGVPTDKLVKVVGSNHYAGTTGDRIAEMAFACRQAGLPIVRLDREDEIDAFYEEVARL